MVAEGMAQRIGALGRQTVLAVFVGGGVAFAVGMGGQTTCSIVAEGLFAAVGIEGEGEVLIGVVVVFGVLSQRIGNTHQLSFRGVGQFGFVTGAVGNPVGLMVFVIVVGGTAAVRIGYRQQQTVAGIFETGDVFQRVDIGQSGRIADNALAARYAPTLAEPAGTVLVGIIAAAPY